MKQFNFSKEQFIEWTTKGYPIQFSELMSKESFLSSLSEFVNFNDNSFFSDMSENMVNIYSKPDDLVLSVIYQNDRVVMLSAINDEEVEEEVFSNLEKQKIIGHACVGVITFCQTMSEVLGLENEEKNVLLQDQTFVEANKNIIWPLKS